MTNQVFFLLSSLLQYNVAPVTPTLLFPLFFILKKLFELIFDISRCAI